MPLREVEGTGGVVCSGGDGRQGGYLKRTWVVTGGNGGRGSVWNVVICPKVLAPDTHTQSDYLAFASHGSLTRSAKNKVSTNAYLARIRPRVQELEFRVQG